MADHVGGGEADGAETIDALQLAYRIGQPAHPIAAGNVDLPRIAADYHPAVLAEAGEEHLHLLARGVLRFVEDDEGIRQRAAAHEGDRRDLDFARGQPPLDLFGRHAIVERVVQRAQVGIDLFLHVTGQEAQLFARFHRRTRKDQALHAAGDQLRHRLRHREVGLARSRRT